MKDQTALEVRELQPETLTRGPSHTTTLDQPISDEARRVTAAVVAEGLRSSRKND